MRSKADIFRKFKRVSKTIFSGKNLSQVETKTLARELSEVLCGGDTIFLKGPIGSGKTFFARALIEQMLLNQEKQVDEIPSPTFSLVQVYDNLKPNICHFDLFRLSNSSEVLELGLTDFLDDNICLIEWPEILDKKVLKRYMSIIFSDDVSEFDRRNLLIEFHGSNWQNIF